MSSNPDVTELEKLSERSITKMSNADSLTHIGKLIDKSDEMSFERGSKRAIFLLEQLSERDLTDADQALIEYFKANAWATRARISSTGRSWSWEAPELQEQMLALSRASNHLGFASLDKVRQCQILTNHANLLNAVGRSIDAIAVWDEALKIIPGFAMALGNRGAGLRHYAGLVDDDWTSATLALHAFDSLRSAAAKDAVYEFVDPRATVERFSSLATEIAGAVDIDAVREMQDLEHGNYGRSKAERVYRVWCLQNRLFLSPLNELGPYPAAATDDLMLPPITESLNARPESYLPPPIFGFFSQLKQEYASARFMLFEGVNSTKVHFSDRGVEISDTLDYPQYSLASERVRTAFRIAYSLLDKVAFLVDYYWRLGKEKDRISFKNVWMVERKTSLLPSLEKRKNLPLRGLFWLSKELFDEQLKQTTSADAQELHSIRNALEHTYLRVHEGWAKPYMTDTTNNIGFGVAIGSDELEAKAVRLMKMARSALHYVTFAIGIEERKKRFEKPCLDIGTMPIYRIHDRHKRRDFN